MANNNKSTDDIITETISEQNKYTDAKIREAVSNLSVAPTMVLGTADSGVVNAIWIENES